MATYEERNRLKAWLYRITIREAARHRRSLPPPSAMDIDDLDEASPECPEAIAQANETRAQFDRLLATLDEPGRTVFVLYEIEELTMAEVAECPVQTAYSRYNAAKKQLFAAARHLEARGGLR